jgi:hypothetical protein
MSCCGSEESFATSCCSTRCCEPSLILRPTPVGCSMRVTAKYQLAGLTVYTKLDLAEQVRADCAGGTCPRQVSTKSTAPHIA